MYSSLGSLAVLLLLIAVCAAMLYRVERFDTFVGDSNGADSSVPTPVGADSSVPKPVGVDSSVPTPVGVDSSVPTPVGVDSSVVSTGASATAAAAAAAVPTASEGSSSLPSDIKTLLSDIGLTAPSLQQGNSFTATTPQTTVDTSSSNQIAELKQQVAELQTQNRRYEMNMYKERQNRKRCPDISQYIRKDSIPCYNCSL